VSKFSVDLKLTGGTGSQGRRHSGLPAVSRRDAGSGGDGTRRGRNEPTTRHGREGDAWSRKMAPLCAEKRAFREFSPSERSRYAGLLGR